MQTLDLPSGKVTPKENFLCVLHEFHVYCDRTTSECGGPARCSWTAESPQRLRLYTLFHLSCALSQILMTFKPMRISQDVNAGQIMCRNTRKLADNITQRTHDESGSDTAKMFSGRQRFMTVLEDRSCSGRPCSQLMRLLFTARGAFFTLNGRPSPSLEGLGCTRRELQIGKNSLQGIQYTQSSSISELFSGLVHLSIAH